MKRRICGSSDASGAEVNPRFEKFLDAYLGGHKEKTPLRAVS